MTTPGHHLHLFTSLTTAVPLATCNTQSTRKQAVQRAAMLNEIGIMKEVEDHPNAVKLLEVYETHTNYYIVMDCCDGGELFEHITQSKVRGGSVESPRTVIREQGILTDNLESSCGACLTISYSCNARKQPCKPLLVHRHLLHSAAVLSHLCNALLRTSAPAQEAFTERHAAQILRSLMLFLAHMHSKGVGSFQGVRLDSALWGAAHIDCLCYRGAGGTEEHWGAAHADTA